MLSPAGPVRIMYTPSDRPNSACVVHCVGSSASASSPIEQPCPRSAYRPVRGSTSLPTSVAAEALPAPSVPPLNEYDATTGALPSGVPCPGWAVTSCDGPRSRLRPLLTALTMLAQSCAPVPGMLSNSSGCNPGSEMVRRQVLACEPTPTVATSWLPSVPL